MIFPGFLFQVFLAGTAYGKNYEAFASRTYFYAGGQYENVTEPLSGPGEFFVGQVYVEKLVPERPCKPYPLVFIPGAGQTATNFLNTPDDREGWASYFLREGYTVYLTDPPQRGRSAYVPGSTVGAVEEVSVNYVQKYFTTSEKFAPDEWPQAKEHTQWVGSGLKGDPVFDAFLAAQVQLQLNASIADQLTKPAYSALLDKIGPAVLVTHSQSGPYGWVLADARPRLVKGIIALEPEGPPFVNETGPTGPARVYGVTRLSLVFSPPVSSPAKLETVQIPPPKTGPSGRDSCTLLAPSEKRTLVNLVDVPVVLVTGSASYHAPYDYCTVEFLKQVGLRSVTWLDLGAIAEKEGKKGLKGNGHFVFLERNSAQVAGLVRGWLERVVDVAHANANAN